MRIFWLTLDSSCFSTRRGQHYPGVDVLLKWNETGWVDLVAAQALVRERQKLTGPSRETLEAKTKDISIDIAPLVSARRLASGELGCRATFEQIAGVLFGGERQLTSGQLADVEHINTHIWCERDIFVTRDRKHFLKNAKRIQRRLGALVMSPTEAVAHIDNAWKADGFMDPRTRHIKANVIAGTCELGEGGIGFRSEDGAFHFNIQVTQDWYYFLQGQFYGSDGSLLAEFGREDVRIARHEVRVSALGIGYIAEPRCRIYIGDKRYGYVLGFRGSHRFLELRVLANYKMVVLGELYTPSGNLIAKFARSYAQFGEETLNRGSGLSPAPPKEKPKPS